ncbi:hypothetical protein QXB70_002110 [Vibrio fluvialis]|uniref:hypothetical protein n=1 Tax=Vibrio furnissii TaxID=29494 RepID=UPI0012AD8F15|nr:hypothetical protein [Vibrio furnissii]ELO1812413.1 hypothetical protein [Vibrio fluvialis]
MTHVDLILHQSHKDEITSYLNASDIRFSEKTGFSVSPSFDEVLLFIDSLPWEAIAAIIVAWLARKPKRRVKFTFIDNSSIDATNYSKEELKELLSAHRQVNLFLHDNSDHNE